MDEPRDREFEHASSKLDEGLKSCRAVLSGYRALFASEQRTADCANDNPSAEDLPTDA
jgi:hypothetical protein